MIEAFFFLLGLLLGCYGGWNLAHGTVADECVRLGGFYVGERVFKCVEVIKNAD